MKKDELVQIIRTVVREEIEHSLPQFLMEVLAEKISNQGPLLESRAVASAPITPAPVQRRRPAVQLETPLRQPSANAPKLFKNDSPIGKILNETVGGIPSEEEVTEMTAVDSLNNLPQEVLDKNPAVAAVAGALNRDYSKLLKAVEKKVRR